MSNNSSNTSGGGIGIAGLLGVAFIILKLTHVIDWDWVWVLAPFWIGIGLALLILIPLGIVLLVAYNSDKRAHKRYLANRGSNRASFSGYGSTVAERLARKNDR